MHLDGWHQASFVDAPGGNSPFWREIEGDVFHAGYAIFTMCRFGFYTLLRDWWTDPAMTIPLEIEIDDLPLRRDHLLALAAKAGSIPICEELLKRGMPINGVNPWGRYGSALAAAAFFGKLHVVEFLVENGADINLPLEYHGSALCAAVYSGESEVVKYLVEKGANVNATYRVHGSPLAAAAEKARMGLVEYLVEKGAKVSAPLQNLWYGSALAPAAHSGAADIVEFLLAKANEDVPFSQRDLDEALETASSQGHEEVVEILLDSGAQLRPPDS
jgi:ankyrin repeat protein